MNKETLYWIVCIILTALFFNLITGCANTQMAQRNAQDAEYRKQTDEYVKSQKKQIGTRVKNASGPLEVPADLYAN